MDLVTPVKKFQRNDGGIGKDVVDVVLSVSLGYYETQSSIIPRLVSYRRVVCSHKMLDPLEKLK